MTQVPSGDVERRARFAERLHNNNNINNINNNDDDDNKVDIVVESDDDGTTFSDAEDIATERRRAHLSSPYNNDVGDRLRAVRALVMSENKTQLLDLALKDSESPDAVALRARRVELDRVEARRARDAASSSSNGASSSSSSSSSSSNDGQRALFVQAFEQLASLSRIALLSSQQPWQVNYVGEGGQDVGGLFRDQLDEFCAELQSPVLSLFVPSANGVHGVGDDRDVWVARATATTPRQLAMFEFVGRVIGVALRTGNQLNINLSSVFWKFMVDEQPDASDLRLVDLLCARRVDALRSVDCDASLVDGETFVARSHDGGLVELVRNGAARRVTLDNRRLFAKLLERYRLREGSLQHVAVRRGLAAVVPIAALSLMVSLSDLEYFDVLYFLLFICFLFVRCPNLSPIYC